LSWFREAVIAIFVLRIWFGSTKNSLEPHPTFSLRNWEMSYWDLAFLLFFAVVFVFAGWAYVLARKLLRYVKEHNPEKYEWLMSSNWAIIDGFINESFIWANSARLGQFVREEKDSADRELRDLVRSYRRTTTAMLIWLGVGLAIILIAGLTAAP
jgi:hypothetical protein